MYVSMCYIKITLKMKNNINFELWFGIMIVMSKNVCACVCVYVRVYVHACMRVYVCKYISYLKAGTLTFKPNAGR